MKPTAKKLSLTTQTVRTLTTQELAGVGGGVATVYCYLGGGATAGAGTATSFAGHLSWYYVGTMLVYSYVA
jgi:hypothetical protein